jgi:hypothetical protein
LFAWIPPSNYKPIQPGERGTIGDGVAAVRRLPEGDALRPIDQPVEPALIDVPATNETPQLVPEAPASTTPSSTPSTVSATTQPSANSTTTTTTTAPPPTTTTPPATSTTAAA